MVGIVGILLLGSLAWSAVGALVSAVGAAGSSLTSATNPPAPLTLAPVEAVTPSAFVAATPTAPLAGTPAPSPTLVDTATESVVATPTVVVAGRNPWILLPQPEPGGKVAPGQVTLEARGRGDAPITAMRLELDGAALATAVDQRSETTWRGSATAKIAAGQHSVRATVTDADGRSGSFRWTFTAAPGP